ncbi:splicing factor 3A subunit 2 [Monocercomonoides exilis]|uniref:splicing factor 3A subunit 2 n=1 Tax=Monocercomonoides exilis TaxID=2049356 RepID=UPI0035594F77|nr:splicing factor 3A subunit 2 [Monocercomonoides exilis]|eukprot:MONOS_193.1-p1 / transcript=MONOS_193.1 / gene=MONOS_193 / organism=Monocercomonoides_exilis_PA203 / gene_product=splicing factor 3A subunit 2 / transcript_product=splicing factor 3A subunit 2 / location=Mono_scaffold00003:205733-206687(+) / protein_length=222 / sequence_SO=supercontig / SO=protein_coding / is_pseudo=false
MLDRENWGAKTGSGGPASKEWQNVDRRERLRKLALETVDLSKDPYFMQNYLGQFECKLCFTVHLSEANYLAHTQGKRHQQNLKKRSFQQAKDQAATLAPAKRTQIKKTFKIGRPGYRLTKQRDPATKQYSLLIEIQYPEIKEGIQPRYRVMSAYEHPSDDVKKDYQYLLFAAEPYETIAFKVPKLEIERSEGQPYSHMNDETKTFTFFITFKNPAPAEAKT